MNRLVQRTGRRSHIVSLPKSGFKRQVYSQILHFNSIAHKLLESSINASFKWDYRQADQIIAQIESIGALENDITTMISSKKLDPIVSSIFSLIFESSRRTIEYSRNIAEVTPNKTVEEISLTPLRIKPSHHKHLLNQPSHYIANSTVMEDCN